MFTKKNLLGVGFTDESIKDVLEYIEKTLEKRQKKYYVVTPNPELLVIANKDLKYKEVLNNADLALIDGIGIVVAGKVLGINFKNRITGVDLLENLCKHVDEKPITVGFLGGRPGVAEKTVECLREKYPRLKVAFAVAEISDLASKKDDLKTDILFVAFGSPKQEFWIAEHLDKLPVKVAVGVGGAFDFISGRVPRAPKLIRETGLEWLFRLIIQPWRMKRQISLLEFGYLVLKEKFSIFSLV